MSSFTKRGNANSRPTLKGTQPSLQHGDLRISTGVSSLDHLLGGGLGLGQLLLLGQDEFNHYAAAMTKYFVAEGVASGHEVMLVAPDNTLATKLKELPFIVSSHRGWQPPLAEADAVAKEPEPEGATSKPKKRGVRFGGEETAATVAVDDTGDKDDKNDSMKIAWRYQQMPQVKSAIGSNRKEKYCHTFDIGKTMSVADREAGFLKEIKVEHDKEIHPCEQVLSQLETQLQPFRKSNNKCTSVARVMLYDFGSWAWSDGTSQGSRMLYRFLLKLRALLRRSYAVCMLAYPHSTSSNATTTARLEMLCDAVVKLDSFQATPYEHDPALQDYHGFFRLGCLPKVEALTCTLPDTFDLAFKLKRKGLIIELLHLPPELSDTAARPQEDTVKAVKKPKSKALCQPNPTKHDPLDF